MNSFLQNMIAEKPTENQQASSLDLMSSAKVVMEAAQSTMNNETEKVDKERVAGAAADLLNAGSHCGKLGDEGFGKYVGKAETYLRSYQSSPSAGGGIDRIPDPNTTDGDDSSEPPNTHSSEPEPEPKSESETGGFRDNLKMAEGILGRR